MKRMRTIVLLMLLTLGPAPLVMGQTIEPAPPQKASPAGAASRIPAPEKAAGQAADTLPAAKPAAPAKPLRDFRPSEEIQVDKAVDFPADI